MVAVGVTAAVGVGSAGALAADVFGATEAGADAEALAPEALALLEELAAGCDEPQALTSSVPAITEAPASQRSRAGRMTFFHCMPWILETAVVVEAAFGPGHPDDAPIPTAAGGADPAI
ncbi:MAG TPA: hypothetical protein VHW06_21595 [Streptosporangiaceae bacterium]|jgi:hypothetical protein|nr:hypothetical protein [Streptosporangiaceae bacterium]